MFTGKQASSFSFNCQRPSDKTVGRALMKLKNLNHSLHHRLPTRVNVNKPYTIRHNSDQMHFIRTFQLVAIELKGLKNFLLLNIFNNM